MTNPQMAAVGLFKPNKQESKAQTTDNAARAIIDSEASRREAKTARLREARLKMEAEQPAVAPVVKKAKAAPRKKKA